ncbi:hypothetical protein HRG_000471 [Hirsutella rhossiliensis]|uniref:Infection structure specific protein n=1 Tax=Hirsutella rhossiliensis TaxID=111463 RepID=A0A9P8N8S8_9HYPO|nr:uncharacterized protein HRG_00471 [Hirsutella rhossiliensis]KAH0967829.1 hypothetical protein HRG_00471 [Hirsutella rhossiliensis]
MQSIFALLVALAASALADVHFNAAMPVLAARDDAPQASATKPSINPECKSVLKTFPTPPPEIKSEFKKSWPTNPCDFSTPASLSTQVASYSSAVSAWGTENKEKLSVCSNFSKFSAFTDCNKQPGTEPTKVSAAAAAVTENTSMSGMSGMSDATKSGNAANRQPGMAVAAVAAAGFALVL